MADQGLSYAIRPATADDELNAILSAALDAARSARGGLALVTQIWGEDISPDLIAKSLRGDIAASRLWIAEADDAVIAGALVGEGCLRAVWVDPPYRRRGVARALVNRVLTSDHPPRDAWALPGDRATKSLYESVGWKARLLTMRGE